MPKEAISDFSLPWCRALFDDPAWRPILTLTRLQSQTGTENALTAETLWTDRTIRTIQSFEKPKHIPNREEEIEEVRMLFSLGSGVDGMGGICHGGLVGLMLDEVLSLMVAVVTGSFAHFTVELNVGFKNSLGTPRVVLCRAWLNAENPSQGRKVWVNGTVEDGEGGVFAVGDALFVRMRENL